MPLNILYLDDEEGNASDYRNALRQTGNTVKTARTLKQAFILINASLQSGNQNYDLVVIDLRISGEIPDDLMANYQTIERQKSNEGQALGQWLWINSKENRTLNWPKYCYISNLTSQYSKCRDLGKQEFGSMEVAKKYVLDKTSIKPFELEKVLHALFAN